MKLGLVAAAAAAVTLVLVRADGARVRATRIHVSKSAHTMEVLDGERVLGRYSVAIGPGGAGPKRREGDRTTPVGRYHVVQRGPSSAFHLFMLIDYPNAEDRARFRKTQAAGELPSGASIGGAIGIHGGNPDAWRTPDDVRDWTLGCIAVTNAEIERIAAAVPDGTAVDIED
jgi:murein L,D-transpeptidase YafK